MVHCDSTIDALFQIFRNEKNPPKTDVVEAILMAFISGNAVEKRSE
jgi:hypothetical protein